MRHTHPRRRTRGPHGVSTNSAMAQIIEQNIEALAKMRQDSVQQRTVQDRIADALTAFSGSVPFVYFHVVWFAVWVAINLRWTPLKPFDPFPFGLLTMIVSLEAIFLSTFVLISQNRMAFIADRRADLDLQIDLLSEHEITRILALVDAIADHLGIEEARNPDIDDFEKDVTPEEVLQEIEKKRAATDAAAKRRDV